MASNYEALRLFSLCNFFYEKTCRDFCFIFKANFPPLKEIFLRDEKKAQRFVTLIKISIFIIAALESCSQLHKLDELHD